MRMLLLSTLKQGVWALGAATVLYIIWKSCYEYAVFTILLYPLLQLYFPTDEYLIKYSRSSKGRSSCCYNTVLMCSPKCGVNLSSAVAVRNYCLMKPVSASNTHGTILMEAEGNNCFNSWFVPSALCNVSNISGARDEKDSTFNQDASSEALHLLEVVMLRMSLEKPLPLLKEPLVCHHCEKKLVGHIVKMRDTSRYYCNHHCLIEGEERVAALAGRVS